MKEHDSRLKKYKSDNRKDIAMILYKDGYVSRVELAKRLGLTKASISILVAEMIEQGLIAETGNTVEKKGKNGPRERLLTLSGAYGSALGINIERDYVSIGICDLQNKTIKSAFRRTSEFSREAVPFLTEIADMAATLLVDAQPPNLLGCAVTIIGTVDQQTGVSVNSFGIVPKNTNLAKFFAEKLSVPVWVENNVRALAMANYNYHSSAHEESCVFLKYGQGLGSAIIIDSNLLMGSTNEAGEVGHTVVAGNEALCECGRTGCLETLVREEAILRNISLEKHPVLNELCGGDRSNLEIEKVLRALEGGEDELLTYFADPIKYLAQTIANLYIVVNPNIIILYGMVFQSDKIRSLLFENLREILKSDAILSVLTISQLESRKNYYGAADLVLRKYFESGALPQPATAN